MQKYTIFKLQADKIIRFCANADELAKADVIGFDVDLDQESIYKAVVDKKLLMDSCALFDQFRMVLDLKEDDANTDCLINQIVILDFDSIFKGYAPVNKEKVEGLITNGFKLKYNNEIVTMLPFDKSGSMGRKSRLSFINEKYLDVMNRRLNLDIDFDKLDVILSKYYAYRGLYLSTAKRIEHKDLEITPQTLIVISDVTDRIFYKKDAIIEQGKPHEDNPSLIDFETIKVDEENITVPFDGQGLISPSYAGFINEIPGLEEANSFQVRLPFAKGMLHKVDYHAFLSEFDDAYEKQDKYIIKDAFGIERDIKGAHIILTESMFKCFGWLKMWCEDKKEDPMVYYCKALEKYKHALYISGTDMPYGHARVTHLSYQFLNTLNLSEEQFDNIVNQHLEYVKNPIKYLELTQGQITKDDEDKAEYDFPNWQRALLCNSSFARLKYVEQQLKNMQVSLMTKLAYGKLVVKGQTRYMARDLYIMLVNMIADKNGEKQDKKKELRKKKIFAYRFFMPQGNENKNEMGFKYDEFCGFFRSPHLSRNEQCALVPMVLNEHSGEVYKNDYDIFNRYFGHLTGIVMFGNESIEPMALGGADFDGDLANMIMDKDVVSAIIDGVYEECEKGKETFALSRKESVPYIKIPSVPAQKQKVPRLVPYALIKNTFSNKIGEISNAAIRIGQSEYGKESKNNSGLRCSMCTILTGLEIDAAKNGVHPDLTIIKDDSNSSKQDYLVFREKFEKLKNKQDYHYNNLKVEKNDDEYQLECKGIEDSITYKESNGTYINKLPVLFMDNIKIKLDIPLNEEKDLFYFPGREENNDNTNKFKGDCNKVFDTYGYYSSLYKFINKEINKEKDNKDYQKRIEELLYKQYDEEYVDDILEKKLPYIRRTISEKITSYVKYKDIEFKINDKKWHLLTKEQKVDFLRTELGIDTINEDEWMLVIQGLNHNYKIFWYILKEICSGMTPTYSDYKKVFYEKVYKGEKRLKKMKKDISDALDKKICSFVDANEKLTSECLYDICLTSLKKIDNDAKKKLPLAKRIEIMFNITEDQFKKSKFFWDCYKWEELEKYIVKETPNA